MAAPWLRKLSTIWPVTSFGKADTPFFGDAVVPGKDQYGLLVDLRMQASLDHGHLDSQCLKFAQGPKGFALVIHLGPGLGGHIPGRPDGLDDPGAQRAF